MLPKGVSLDMLYIPGGSFRMGSNKNEKGRRPYEGPQHKVKVPAFFMGKYPVTQAQWRAVAKLPLVKLELKAKPSQFKGDNRPVEHISWHHAVEFCQRLSRYSGKRYRLPSESEWEYACRAGTTTHYYFGDTLTRVQANFSRKKTTWVGQYPANKFGLYDMHGNVREWCEDVWHNNYGCLFRKAPTDGSAWLKGADLQSRVMRGGSWFDTPGICRSASRSGNSPFACRDYVGFRVCCVPPFA